jgi:hypothetical protein
MAARSEDRSGSAACPSSGAPSSNPGLGAGLPRSVLAGFGTPGFIALTALAVLGFLWLGHGLPRVPWVASDTQSYLSFSPVRPHGYSLFLAAYRLLFSDLAYLPSLQFGLYVGAVFLLALAVGRRTCNFAAAAVTLLITFAAADMTDFPYILSDCVNRRNGMFNPLRRDTAACLAGVGRDRLRFRVDLSGDRCGVAAGVFPGGYCEPDRAAGRFSSGHSTKLVADYGSLLRRRIKPTGPQWVFRSGQLGRNGLTGEIAAAVTPGFRERRARE